MSQLQISIYPLLEKFNHSRSSSTLRTWTPMWLRDLWNKRFWACSWYMIIQNMEERKIILNREKICCSLIVAKENTLDDILQKGRGTKELAKTFFLCSRMKLMELLHYLVVSLWQPQHSPYLVLWALLSF